MRHGNLVGALKTSTGFGGGILTLLACGAFACTPVDLEPVAVGGSAGSIGRGGSSGALGVGGTAGINAGNGGSAGAAGIGGSSGTGGTGGTSGSAGDGGRGGTSSGTGGTGGTGLLPDGGDPGPVNLIANSDFEQALSPWTMIAQAGTIMLSTDCNGPPEPDAGVSDAGEPERLHGLQCGRGTGRTAGYHGPAYPLNGILTRERSYTVSAFGRIAQDINKPPTPASRNSIMKLTMRVMCTQEGGLGLPVQYYNLVADTPVTDSEWLFMTNQFYVPGLAECPVMTDIRVYLEGPPANVDILVDDVSIYEL